jgi:hypothetical protein
VQPGHEDDAPSVLNTRQDIRRFCGFGRLDLVRAPLMRKLSLNLAIAEYGLTQGGGSEHRQSAALRR